MRKIEKIVHWKTKLIFWYFQEIWKNPSVEILWTFQTAGHLVYLRLCPAARHLVTADFVSKKLNPLKIRALTRRTWMVHKSLHVRAEVTSRMGGESFRKCIDRFNEVYKPSMSLLCIMWQSVNALRTGRKCGAVYPLRGHVIYQALRGWGSSVEPKPLENVCKEWGKNVGAMSILMY